MKKAHRTADKLQSGIIWINNFNVSKVELPFGGFKQSGIGRECSAETVHYYTQSKSVYIEMNEIDCPLYQPWLKEQDKITETSLMLFAVQGS